MYFVGTLAGWLVLMTDVRFPPDPNATQTTTRPTRHRPKLRKWYGQDSSVGERNAAEELGDGSGGGGGEEEVPTVDTEAELREWDKKPRRATLVTDANTQLGEAIIMQLIVAKQPVTALGVTPEEAETRYGPYVTGEEEGGG